MIKLEDLLKEAEQERLEEGWKENIMAAVIAVAGMFPAKAQKAAPTADKPGITQTVDQGSLKVDMGTLFPSGKYIIRDEAGLKKVLAQISNYISKNPTAGYKVEIISSESKVPNVDAEKPNKPRVDTGYLATRRAEAVKFAMDEFAKEIKETGAFKGSLTTDTDIKVAQGPDWNPAEGDKSTDSKFTEHQYVKIIVTAIPKSDKTTADYSAYSNRGEVMHKINPKSGAKEAFAMAFYATKASKDVKDQGGLDTRYQDVLLKTIKRNTSLAGTKDEQGVYTATYLIPSSVWNSTVDPSHELTDEDMAKFAQYKVN